MSDNDFEENPKLYPCACTCGCVKDSTVAWTHSEVLGRHARCAECAEEAHMNAHPSVNVKDKNVPKDITEVYVPTRAEQKAAKEAQLEVYKEIWNNQWESWQNSLPEKFKNAETEHSQVKERLRRLKSGEYGVASLVVLGAPGLGKTWLAIAYANAAIRAGFFKPSEVMFGSEAELLASAANSAFGEVEAGLRKVTNSRIKMLIIDDVGRGTWLNESMRAKVFSLVLDRYWSENRVVVFTSNLAPADLGAYIGDGAMDRLRSLVGGGSLVLDTESKRKKVTEEMLARVNEEPEPVSPPAPHIIPQKRV